MAGTKEMFDAIVEEHGSTVIFHRADSLIPCPCRTPEGFRDMTWHLQNPLEPMCNEQGMLPDPAATINISIKGWVQPVTSARGAKLPDESILALFGQVQADDHIGIFPEAYAGTVLNFYDWSRSGEDYVEYNSRRFFAVNANLIADPQTGNPRHHWEVGLRLMSNG
jgi:hypothetical protein